MIPKECKRLIEVDFPIVQVSYYASKEKESRAGHIPKLHIWPAARPTASGRAVLLALLLPDPCDPRCPESFKRKAKEALEKIFISSHSDLELRNAILSLIGKISNIKTVMEEQNLRVVRNLIKAAHPNIQPLVVDPFAGGGSIPMEALRLGCDTFSSDINSIACLIQRVVIEDIPRYGTEIAKELRDVAIEIIKKSERALAEFYPIDPDGKKPINYLWARTIRCESSNCGAEIPLARSFWISKKFSRKKALRYRIKREVDKPPSIVFELFEPEKNSDVPKGSIYRAKATCFCCGAVMAPDRVRTQLIAQKGGTDVIFNEKGERIGGALLLAVVSIDLDRRGRFYRLARKEDYDIICKAMELLKKIDMESLNEELSNIPDEPTPSGGGSGAGRAFSVQRYGMTLWRNIITARQNLALYVFSKIIRENYSESIAKNLLGLCFGKMIDSNTAQCTWQLGAELMAHSYVRYALPMVWDYTEGVPIAGSSGSIRTAVKRCQEVLPILFSIKKSGTVQVADAQNSPLPDDVATIWFTDPPYYDAIPYSDISDLFFIWLKRTFLEDNLFQDPFNHSNTLTVKDQEIIEDEARTVNGFPKDKVFFEKAIERAFIEGARVLDKKGIGCVVFAHKTTEGWEALLNGVIHGGWTITASWPIATEMRFRTRARDSAALATSIHLICRPRPASAGVGDWANVLRELPGRVGDWMERLQGEGIRGADLVFACIGPALEIYSRYSRVEDAEGREIPLGGDAEATKAHQRGYLSFVWEVVGRSALEQILGTDEARARNSAVGALEEDARLTALFLWTLQSTEGLAQGRKKKGKGGDEDELEEGKTKAKGFSLIFDVVRRFAQPLGIHLEEWEGRIVETSKGVVRLLPVKERTRQLFGAEGVEALGDRFEAAAGGGGFGGGPMQVTLFPEEGAVEVRGRGKRRRAVKVKPETLKTRREATTLDRVHAAMLLQAGGQANALRALLVEEVRKGPDFLRLANSLSALYPKGSEEKRLLDAMLLAVPK